jgi:hypothetical protein
VCEAIVTTPKKITAAIRTLESAGYKVTPPAAPVGRPRQYEPAQILAEIDATPDASNREIAARVGCHEDTVARVRRKNLDSSSAR